MFRIERLTIKVTTVSIGSLLIACSPAQIFSRQALDSSVQHQHQHQQMDHHSGMMLGPADAEYDLRFIDAMVPHHRGAIAMANEALQKSKRPEIKSLAQNIIKAQSREENQLMRQWRQAWYPDVSSKPVTWHSQMGHSMMMDAEQVNQMMMYQDLGAADNQFDLRFLNAMIAHHEGAVTMAADALEKSKRPEIKQLANEIITSQQTEINQMQRWRQVWYNQ